MNRTLLIVLCLMQVACGATRTPMGNVPLTVVGDSVRHPPYSSVCHIEITRQRKFRRDAHTISTGFLIGDRFLLTAAHNVFSPDYNRAFLDAVRCGWHDGKAQFEVTDSFTLDQIRVAAAYRWKFGHDYAMLRLPRHAPDVAAFRIPAAGEVAVYENDAIHIAGYPGGGKGGKTMYRGSTTTFDLSEPPFIYYGFETETGSSGSPIYVRRANDYVVAGVHVGNGLARRIDRAAADEIRSWQDKQLAAAGSDPLLIPTPPDLQRLAYRNKLAELRSKSATVTGTPAAKERLEATWDKEAREYTNNINIAPSALVTGGAAWQEAVLVGFASYLAKRAEAEALYVVMRRASTDLCPPNQFTIIPSTCLYLRNVERQPPAWSTLRSAVARDVKYLPDSLVSHVAGQNPKFAQVRPLAIAGMQAVRLIESGEDATWTLIGLTRAFPCEEECPRTSVAPLLHAVGAAVEIVVTDSTFMKQPSSTHAAVELLIGTLNRVYENDVVSGSATERAKYEALLVDVANRVRELRNLEKRVRQPDPDTAVYAQYALAAWNIVSIAPRFAPFELDTELTRQIFLADAAVRSVHRVLDRSRRQDFAGAFVEAQALTKLIDLDITVPFFNKYGPFLVQLATAKDAESVKQTLATAAAPAGSFRAKRDSAANSLTLNSYLGGQGGFEWVDANPENAALAGGFFAPVGVERSWGLGKSGLSIGIFASIIDIGALFTVRDGVEIIGSDSLRVQNDATIGLKQVLSPGLYGTLGIGRDIPFTLGVGASLQPDLRRVLREGDTGEGSKTSAKRVLVFMGFDFPLFRF
jgi:V8-like Glu-specific endopeptidase